MSDYTPNTEDVRAAYSAKVNEFESGFVHDEKLAKEFDRWLAEHDRELQAKAWEEGFRQEVASCASRTSMIDNAVTLKINPYESEEA